MFMMQMRFASIHLRVVATTIGYICQEHAALFTTWLDRNLLRVDYARINRIDTDDNGKIVALGIRMEGSACDAAMDVLKQSY
jgi:hypothetical protein